ncbi:MAG TPA: hypothetical protein EYQ59_10945, partial [Planctomycetes bacterium]|nr:hypothetical protein [Planctomycetota bacterium]
WEWCHDRYGSAYYSTSPPSNPTGPASGFDRVLRGGSWNHDKSNLRSAYRHYNHPTGRGYHLGFRVLSSRP